MNNIAELVLGDFPENEARDFLLKHALEPEVHKAVTDEAWCQIFEVRLFAKSRGLPFHTCSIHWRWLGCPLSFLS
jgi:hypothetical protein